MITVRKFYSLLRHQETFLFLSLWVIYGLMLNSNNLESFNLQQIGIEAIVERGVFYLEGSASPRLQPGVDTFSYEGHIYASKQPGQFMIGAVVYYVIHNFFGLNYRDQYLLSSGLVTFLTTSLLTALATLFVFRFAKHLTPAGSFWPEIAALTFGFATIAMPYSGIAHHDALASNYLVIGCYLLFLLSRKDFSLRSGIVRASAAGILLGLTVTTSALPALMVVVVSLWFFTFRKWILSLTLVLGGILGAIPLLIYDAVCFGDPFLLPFLVPNWTGPFPYPHFRLAWPIFKDNGLFYLEYVTQYVPVFWLALIGLFFLFRTHRREAILFFGLIAVLCTYLLNVVENKGGCMYGPRYLLPAMPFAAICITGFAGARKEWLYAVLLVSLYSAFVNVVGALQGAMYCDIKKFAMRPYLKNLAFGDVPSYPLFGWLLGPAILLCLIVLKRRRSIAKR